MSAIETNGAWGAVTQLKALPANALLDPTAAPPGTILEGVSCRTAGSCTAVGIYSDTSGSQQSFAVGLSHDSWQDPEEIKPPSNATGGGFLSAVDCDTACEAVGYYPLADGNNAGMAVELPN